MQCGNLIIHPAFHAVVNVEHLPKLLQHDGGIGDLLCQMLAINRMNQIDLIDNLTYFISLKMTDKIENMLGKGGIYLIRKFFGIILLAIAARFFTANVTQLIDQFQGVC